MTRCATCFVVALAVLCAVSAHADEPKIDPKADEVMTRIAAFYSGLDSYKDKTHVDAAVVIGGDEVPLAVESTLTFAKPRKVIIEANSDHPNCTGVFMFDGDTYWVYVDDLRQYRKTKTLDETIWAQAPFVVSIVASMFTGDDAIWPPDEDDTDVLAAVYGGKETVSGEEAEVAKLILDGGYIKLWADSDGLVRQASLDIRFGAGLGMRLVETHSEIEVNPEIGPTEFALAIPDGAIAVEEFGKEPQLEATVAAGFPQGEGLIPNGEAAPGFSLKTLDDMDFTLSKLKGKVVLLDFWATWCGPCKMAMPQMQKIHDDLGAKGLVVLGIDNETDLDKVRRYLSDNGYTYPTLTDPGGKMGNEYRISAIPTVYIIDRQGNVAASLIGYSPESGNEIREVLRNLGVE